MDRKPHPSFVAIAVALIIGTTALLTVAARPRFESYRAVDVLELVASGMCFGVALVWLLLRLKGRGL
jgi:hypothetical protein